MVKSNVVLLLVHHCHLLDHVAIKEYNNNIYDILYIYIKYIDTSDTSNNFIIFIDSCLPHHIMFQSR